jgi:hypothetical protein
VCAKRCDRSRESPSEHDVTLSCGP